MESKILNHLASLKKKKRSLKFFIFLTLFHEADQSRNFGVFTSTKCFFVFAQKLAKYFKLQFFSFTEVDCTSQRTFEKFFFSCSLFFFFCWKCSQSFLNFRFLPGKNLRAKSRHKVWARVFCSATCLLNLGVVPGTGGTGWYRRGLWREKRKTKYLGKKTGYRVRVPREYRVPVPQGGTGPQWENR